MEYGIRNADRGTQNAGLAKRVTEARGQEVEAGSQKPEAGSLRTFAYRSAELRSKPLLTSVQENPRELCDLL